MYNVQYTCCKFNRFQIIILVRTQKIEIGEEEVQVRNNDN